MMEHTMEWVSGFRKNVKTDSMLEGGHTCTEGHIINHVMGIIQSHHIGLVRAGVRIKVSERTDLRVKWPIEEKRVALVGQGVMATIPAEAVRLEAGMFRRSKQRWNRWIGRIVLAEPTEAVTLYTVKIHGEDWTLKGYGPVAGAQQPSKVWDVVNVVVDPQRVALTVVDMRSWPSEADLVLDL